MKKLIVILFILTLSGFFVSAQQSRLHIRSAANGFYLEHKVTSKENFYSIGRIYNAHPKEIASYNNLDMSKGLSLGQTIRIPLNAANFTRQKETSMPVYYKTGENEGLLKVSQANNELPVESIRQWNKLSSDKISNGQSLIVGFLVMPGQEVTVSKKEEIVVMPPEPEIIVTSQPVKKEPVKIETPKKELVKTDPSEGFFKSHFDQQVKITPAKKTETVTAGIFKTSSGWDDAKYYMLIDNVQPGTIVKLVNPGNNKAVYAKVLGEMSGIRQNEGYGIRISNSAASALMVTEEEKFIIKVNY